MNDQGLHPGAWWLWALGLAAAASHTTNPLLLASIVAVAALVVAARRGDAPWAVGFHWYLWAAALVVVIRVLFRILTNGAGPSVVFSLPTVPLPGGLTLLGPVSAEALTSGFYDGMRLGALLVCVGAANVLANPKRLLAAAPAALYEVATVLVVSVSVFPQLVESVGRVRRARVLRAGPRTRRHSIRAVLLPVLTDALDRSLQLAASMDSRGYGRTDGPPGSAGRRRTTVVLLTGLVALAAGAFVLLDASQPRAVGYSLLATGLLSGAIGFRLAGRRVHRSRYRPDRWDAAAWLVAGCGIAAAVLTFRAPVASLYPTVNPLTWPVLPVLPLVGLLVAAAPAVLAPVPRPVPA